MLLIKIPLKTFSNYYKENEVGALIGKSGTGIFIDSNIYLIPDNHNYIAKFDTTTCNITNLFELEQSTFSSAEKHSNTIYMISNKLGFIGVLKNPYTIESYYTIDLNVVNQQNMKKRLMKRKKLNRYDKFDYHFYDKVQKGFKKILKKNPKKYMLIDSNLDIAHNEKIILDKINSLI